MEVVSEDEGAMVSMEDIVYQEGSFSKGSSKKRQSHSILLKSKKLKTNSACPTVLLPQYQDKERMCCMFPGSLLEKKSFIDKIFAEEYALLLESKHMKKVFGNITISAVIKNRVSIKNLVVKTKL